MSLLSFAAETKQELTPSVRNMTIQNRTSGAHSNGAVGILNRQLI